MDGEMDEKHHYLMLEWKKRVLLSTYSTTEGARGHDQLELLRESLLFLLLQVIFTRYTSFYLTLRW